MKPDVYDGFVALNKWISDKSKWVQKVGARDANGREVNSVSGKAVKFCLGAACIKFVDKNVRTEVRALLTMAIRKFNPAFERHDFLSDIVHFNDTANYHNVKSTIEEILCRTQIQQS